MARPVVLTEIQLDGDWANISSDKLVRSEVSLTRGKANEGQQTPPGSFSLMLNNRLGRYSPRNPLGPFYGSLGRNTPIRVSLGNGPYGLILSGGFAAAEAGDTAGLSVTGDLDIRVYLQLLSSNWATVEDDIINKWVASGNQRSWSLIRVTNDLSFCWSEDGTAVRQVWNNTVPTQNPTVVRVTMDVNDGAGSHAVTFYEGPTLTGPWTMLGTPQTASGGGTTSIFDSTAPVRIGAANQTDVATWGSSLHSCVFSAQIHNGIDGTTVASPNFAGQPLDPHPLSSSAFTDAQSNTWTPTGTTDAARIWYGTPIPRFYGEISELPAKWDTSGNDAWASIEAADILRRIGQGTQPVDSGLKQHLLTTNPNAYWPLDDGPSATQGANVSYPPKPFYKFTALAPGPVVAFGTGDLGSYLPKGLEITSATNGNLMVGSVGNASSTDSAVEFVYRAEVLGPLTLTLQNHSNFDWKVHLRGDGTNNDVQLSLVDHSSGSPANVDLADTAALAAITDGLTHHIRVRLTQDGADTDYTVHVDGTQVISGTRASHTLSGTSNVHFSYAPTGDDTPVAIGHVAAWTGTGANPVPSIAGTSTAALGFAGETAGARVQRLCDELDVPFTSVGTLADTLAMGVQYSDYFSNQLTEIEATDQGLLYGARDSFAVEYRTRTSLYNQAAAATIDYSAGELSPPFEPIDDDQNTHNDIFAQRREGSSYQATLSTGALSVQAPPDGVGRYKDEVQVNVQTDNMLPEVAGWLLRLGTVDEARYPSVTVNLAAPGVADNAALVAALLAVDIGDRIVITNIDEQHIYDDVSLLVLGYTETIGPVEHLITFNCVPASPYEVMEIEDSDNQSRIGPGDGSTLNEVMTTTETDMDVASSGFLWTTDAGQMPISIMVGGEEMSVTAISGASSPQTFTVTRSVNGVVKTHSTGATVRLKRRAAWAL